MLLRVMDLDVKPNAFMYGKQKHTYCTHIQLCHYHILW